MNVHRVLIPCNLRTVPIKAGSLDFPRGRRKEKTQATFRKFRNQNGIGLLQDKNGPVCKFRGKTITSSTGCLSELLLGVTEQAFEHASLLMSARLPEMCSGKMEEQRVKIMGKTKNNCEKG